MTVWMWLAVAALGGLGAIGRFLLDALASGRWSGRLPIGTLIVNASAALTLGLLTGLALSGRALLLAGTATIGSYSTFSTWMLETHRLSEEAAVSAALANVLVSLAIGLGAAALGRMIGADL